MAELQERLARALTKRYAVKAELGRGGMSVVFLAWDRKHECDVALKVLRPDLASALGPDRFLQEIKTAARLKHPYILKLYDSGEAGGLLYYVMPYVETESLRQRLEREHQLPIADALRIAREVGEALDYAHRERVVHRDIKPENILFEGGHAVVSDFGIALAAANARQTDSGVALGTLEYMSPEQSAAKRELDGRSDIYSLGLVLYEMLTGEPPRLSVDGTVKTLERLRHDVPPGVGQVLRRALATDPEDRFATAGDFVAALARAGPRPFYERRRVQVVAMPGLALVALSTWWILSGGAAALDSKKVVVFPLAERGRSGMGDQVALMIVSALEHTEPLQGADGWRLLTAAQRGDVAQLTPRAARRVARGNAARFFMQGSIVENGDSASVILWLTDTKTGGDIARVTASGSTLVKSLPQLGLEAVTEMLPRLLPPGGHIDLSMLSGRKPGAVANWLQGEREYRGSNFAGALTYFRRAVAEDSLLAAAAVRGAQAASWENATDESATLSGVALKDVALLPSRQAKFARGLAAYYAGHADSAVAWFTRALVESPGWTEAHMQLGETYYHLLPNATEPLDSLAASEFAAAALDSGFSPPRFHLAEIAVRSGVVSRARQAVFDFERVAPEGWADGKAQLHLMLFCVEGTLAADGWKRAAHEGPFIALKAAQALAVAAAFPGCAEDGFRSIGADTTIAMNFRWGALVGLQGLLASQNRLRELRAVIDSTVASGVEYANRFYLADALAGLELADDADAVAHRYETGAARQAVGAGVLWLIGTWRAQHGSVTEADSVLTLLVSKGQHGDPDAARYANALRAQLALGRGDSSALEAMRSSLGVATRDDLIWGLTESLGADRLILANYLLLHDRPAEALATASVMDHSAAASLLPYLPASLTLRRRAAQMLGRKDVAQRCEQRLAKLGRTDLLAINAQPSTGRGP